jgi:hypothetical protein
MSSKELVLILIILVLLVFGIFREGRGDTLFDTVDIGPFKRQILDYHVRDSSEKALYREWLTFRRDSTLVELAMYSNFLDLVYGTQDDFKKKKIPYEKKYRSEPIEINHADSLDLARQKIQF